MDAKYVDSVPIFYFNQSIRDLLHYLLQNEIDNDHIILCDARRKPCGIIHTGKLYKEIAFGLQFDHVLESICDSSCSLFFSWTGIRCGSRNLMPCPLAI